MKIIKQFEDSEFFARAFGGDTGLWLWGLGDNGELYYFFSLDAPDVISRRLKEEHIEEDEWGMVGNQDSTWDLDYVNSITSLSFQDMRRIVKEFGHLVVWS